MFHAQEVTNTNTQHASVMMVMPTLGAIHIRDSLEPFQKVSNGIIQLKATKLFQSKFLCQRAPPKLPKSCLAVFTKHS